MLAAELEELQDAGNCRDGAMAANFRYDHRVPPPREDEFIQFCTTSADLSKKGLQNTQIKYFKEKVRFPQDPAFQESPNTTNLSFGPGAPVNLSPKRDLVRVLNVSRLDFVFGQAYDQHWTNSAGDEPFKDYPAGEAEGADSDQVLDWLNDKLDKSDKEAVKFVNDVLELLNDRLDRKLPFHPVWAAFWGELRDFFNSQSADRWLERLGVEKPVPHPHWVIVLVYKVDETRTLWRPTVLDVEWYPCHFPSPPDLPASRGGHPMDLGKSSVTLVSEFIHQQIRHLPQHFEQAGLLRQRTTRGSSPELRLQRENHRKLLRDCCPELDNMWMKNPC